MNNNNNKDNNKTDNTQNLNANSDQMIHDPYLTEHEYDGIKESDHPLPMWWLFIFYVSIIFAFYYFYQTEHLGEYNIQSEFQSAMGEINKIKAAQEAKAEVPLSEEELAKKMDNPNVVAAGKLVFSAKCAACHREDGGGLIGPNFTDKHWINGTGKRADIIKIAREGVLEKGMPSWKDVLSADELLQVVAFIYSLKGTFVPNGKPPQGNPQP